MEGVIANFRRGRHRTHGNQAVIYFEGMSKDKAEALVGKSVTWTSPKNTVIKGTISAAHGVKGAIRAVFERGLPGQALSQKVKIEDFEKLT